MTSLKKSVNQAHFAHLPEFYRLSDKDDKNGFNKRIKDDPSIQLIDKIPDQLRELIKIRFPSKQLTEEELQAEIKNNQNGVELQEYGVWVYYRWLNKMVHLLDEKEFIEVRTNRNKYKITPEEQDILSSKKVGIIGLSVGQSVALTISMERTCGEIRLADFDTLDLSNLNRLRTGVQNIGMQKTIIAAREISEIDPFIKVVCYHEGITEENIESFITNGGGKIDLLIDECDDLNIKILCRLVSRKYKIPVLMDTSDRGMLDIERFDIEPARSIFHGLIDQFDISNINELTQQQRMQILMSLISFKDVSSKMKYSMNEIGKTIKTWPQLASSVAMGGAVTTDVARRILLNQHHDSGRYYLDLEKLI